MLFHGDQSLLKFLNDAVSIKELAKTREAVFKFIGDFIPILDKSVAEYAIDIKVLQLDLFQSISDHVLLFI